MAICFNVVLQNLHLTAIFKYVTRNNNSSKISLQYLHFIFNKNNFNYVKFMSIQNYEDSPSDSDISERDINSS